MTDTLDTLRRTYDDRYTVWVALQKRYAKQCADGLPCSDTLARLHVADKALRVATGNLAMARRVPRSTVSL